MVKFIRDAQNRGPDGPSQLGETNNSGRPANKGKGGNRGPPKRCDTHNLTTANCDAPLPGGHNLLYQVAISRSPLSPTPIEPKP